MSINNPKGSRRQKVNTHEHLKVVHSFRTQIKPLRDYLNQLLKMVPQYSEPGKRQALLDHIMNVVRDHGNDGLKKHRSLFIQGVKVLGGDSTTNFAAFACDSDGFPKHYGDLFRLLAKYRRYDKVEVEQKRLDFNLSTVHAGDRTSKSIVSEKVSQEVFSPCSGAEARQISLILSILRWPYSVRLDLSERAKVDLLESFATRIQDPCPKTIYSSSRLSERIAGELMKYLPSDYKDPLIFVPSERTYKGGRPGKSNDRRIPISIMYATDLPNYQWSYSGPVGKATVLSEKGGKQRFITSYDGAINSSNIYEKARKILDNIPQDCSADQRKGHLFLKDQTGRCVGSNRTRPVKIYSTDLDAFTDKLVLNAYRELLDLMNSSDFLACITAPIEVNGRTVNPHKSLMGLRGTFELASLVHHGLAIACGLSERVLCGDDLLFTSSDTSVLQRYEALCSYVGLTLNRLKTVISADTGVFCGKVFFRGMDVSPVIPPLYTLTKSSTDFVSAAGDFIASSERMSKGFRNAAKVLVLRLASTFRGIYLPIYLPKKLGGVGIAQAKGLLQILKSKMARLACNIPDEDEPVPSRTIRFPYTSKYEVVYYPKASNGSKTGIFFGFNNLLDSGFTQRFRKRKVTGKKSAQIKDLHSILCYYYSIET